MSQQFLRRSKDRRLGLEPNSFSYSRRTNDGDSSRLGLEPNSFSVGQQTDACDLSKIGLEPNSFAVGPRTDVWESSRLGLNSINSFRHVLCKEVPCLTVLVTRELTDGYGHAGLFSQRQNAHRHRGAYFTELKGEIYRAPRSTKARASWITQETCCLGERQASLQRA